jgi:hypothetical protein
MAVELYSQVTTYIIYLKFRLHTTDHGRTRNLCLLPRIDPTGFMRVKMNIALRKRTLSPVRLVLEDSSKRSFMLFVVVSLQLGSII